MANISTPGNAIDAWHAYLFELLSLEKLSEDTIRMYTTHVRLASKAIPNLLNADSDQIRAWIKGKSVLKFYALRSLFRFCKDAGLIEKNPVDSIDTSETIRGYTPTRACLTNEQARTLCQLPELSKRDRAIIWVMLSTGLRIIEMHRATFEDLTESNGIYRLMIQGKGRKKDQKEPVYISHTEACAALRAHIQQETADNRAYGALFATSKEWRNHQGLGRRAICVIIKQAILAAGITDESVTPYTLRHTAITNALENGAGYKAVVRMARHYSVRSTLAYDHTEDSRAENFINYED